MPKETPPIVGLLCLTAATTLSLLDSPLSYLFRIDVDAKPNAQTSAGVFLTELPTRKLRLLGPSELNHLTII